MVFMDQFSKFTKCYPVKDQKLETIINIIEEKFLNETGIPETILTDNGGQFVTQRWKDYAVQVGFGIRRTSPYNPQANPVERVMRELGRVIRTYFHDRQTQWDKIIERFEKTMNNTEHFSTGSVPTTLHPEIDEKLEIDPRIQPEEERQIDMEEKRREVVQHLERKAATRKTQTDKHGAAKDLEPGDGVWIRLHRRSDASRKTTRKIHKVYDGPYKVREIIRKNAYLIEDLEGSSLRVFNARQLRPHREPKLKNPEAVPEEAEGAINVIRVIPEIKLKYPIHTDRETPKEENKIISSKRNGIIKKKIPEDQTKEKENQNSTRKGT
ncbi:gag-pol fusion protein [Lasius niger]|uniref:Gag-pol fusion protein n=1 Tax=Lasius niger TaxID=67767 RepID=A0A0J7NPU6_LASNI|nr:gag-pol fusion protein [Lasius niger]KMQ93511.1 gag-pol fusion protein [Lasius niger]KMQ94485.1 gag-pol fusion protein [Lasius niger]